LNRLQDRQMVRAARCAVRSTQRVDPTLTRDRRRPEFREYLTGFRLGSIFEMPVPLFTSMIWSRKSAAHSNSRFAEAS
jgi:hypothetical protein